MHSKQLLFMMRDADAQHCADAGGIHYQGRSCKLPCMSEQEIPWPLDTGASLPPRWLDAPLSNFTGELSVRMRTQQLRACGDQTSAAFRCGFLAPSVRVSILPCLLKRAVLTHAVRTQGFDAVRQRAADYADGCSTVVLTAAFGARDGLRQPRQVPAEMEHCYFAFVDHVAAAAVLRRGRTASSTTASSLPQVGVWRLLTVGGNLPFGNNARRNSRVPKMLPHRFFPRAEFCIWVDAKLQLQMAPDVMLQRFLRSRGAGFAALRNLRRHTIGHEYAWISSWMCPQKGRTSPTADACAEMKDQWRLYALEQRGAAGWQSRTAVIEGALLLLDLRDTATLCLLCNWFNEYALFSERDQLGFACA